LPTEILAGVPVIADAPRLVAWTREQISDPAARGLWTGATYAAILVFGAALITEWILRWVLARLKSRLPRRRSDARLIRAVFALLGLVLDLVPIVVFAVIANTAIAMVLEPLTRTRIVLTVLVHATVETRLILCVARSMLLPADTGAVFVPLDAETRNYLYIWTRRFVFWTVFGYAVPRAAWWLGAPGAVYALMLNVAGLVVALLAIIFVLQNRAPIARWIAGTSITASGWGRVRRSLAEIWPVVAILYIAGIYLIYALRIQGGFLYVVRATTLSLVVVVCAQLLVRSIRVASRRG